MRIIIEKGDGKVETVEGVEGYLLGVINSLGQVDCQTDFTIPNHMKVLVGGMKALYIEAVKQEVKAAEIDGTGNLSTLYDKIKTLMALYMTDLSKIANQYDALMKKAAKEEESGVSE